LGKTGRNDPCPCGSGKKYKKCCLARERKKRWTLEENLSNWCQDLEMELGNAGIEEPVFYEKRIKYCQEFCSLFPETSKLILMNMKRAEAESYFAFGLVEKGEKAFRALVEEFPDSAWAYIGWGDMYWLFRESKAPHDFEKKIYRLALERNVTDRDDVLERFRDLEEERKSKKVVVVTN